MQITQLIGQIPNQLNEAYNFVGNIGQTTVHKFNTFCNQTDLRGKIGGPFCERFIRPLTNTEQFLIGGLAASLLIMLIAPKALNYLAQTESWKENIEPIIKPYCERYYRPLNNFDKFLFVGSLISSGVITGIALSTLGIGAFPLTICSSGLLIGASIKFSLGRARKHFDKKAWKKIDEIRQASSTATAQNNQMSTIDEEVKDLQYHVFDHLKDDLKQLDERVKEFRVAIFSPNFEDQLKILQSHLKFLKDIVKANPPDKTLVEELLKEIDKVGKKDQNLSTLEIKKQNLIFLQIFTSLNPLDILLAKDNLSDLNQQIKTLLKAANKPKLESSRETFIQYLEGLQGKLAPYLEIKPIIKPRVNPGNQTDDMGIEGILTDDVGIEEVLDDTNEENELNSPKNPLLDKKNVLHNKNIDLKAAEDTQKISDIRVEEMGLEIVEES